MAGSIPQENSSQPQFAAVARQIGHLRRRASERLLKARLNFVRSRLSKSSPVRSFHRVCVVATLGHQNGIARGAQLQYESFRRLGIDVELLDVTKALRHPFFRIAHEPATMYVFHCGGPEIAALTSAVLPAAKQAYRIAYWAWEMPLPPFGWPSDVVSEIWTCSQYSKTSLAAGYKLPIYVVPHAVPAVQCISPSRTDSKFTVLTLADSRSSFDRKNPLAAVEAFRTAFGSRNDAKLILKISSASAAIRAKLEPMNLNNVEILDQFLDDSALTKLFQSASVLLSLHRAEGFGLPMLEAMALGIPVVGTAWSGNLDFMSSQNSCLIPVSQIPIANNGCYLGFGNATWAEPDVQEAARALLRLKNDKEFAHCLSRAGHATAQKLVAAWQPPPAV